MPSSPEPSVHVAALADAPATWSMGMLLERLIGPDDCAGAFSASVVTQPPGQASPLHVHTREAEAWFILDGALTYRAGEQTYALGPGHFIYLPAGVPHAFRTTGSTPSRYLALAVPGGLLDLYDEIGTPTPAHRLPDGGLDPDDVTRWLDAGPRYGLSVVGPPLPE